MFGKYTIKYLESSQLSLNKDANKYFNELKFTVLLIAFLIFILAHQTS